MFQVWLGKRVEIKGSYGIGLWFNFQLASISFALCLTRYKGYLKTSVEHFSGSLRD